MKRCCRCKTEQPTSEFYRDSTRADGLRAQCKTCKRELDRAYAQTERGRKSIKTRSRRYVKAHPEAAAAAVRRWRAAHPEYSAESNRRWREANPTAASEYHQANREKAIARVNRRRRAMADVTFGPVSFADLWKTQGESCALCEQVIDRSLRHPDPMSPSVDHIVPLSKGGTHEQANLQWAHLVCNIRKGATVPVSATP